MQLTHLHIENYRAARDIEIPLSPFVCITGENNAGKSTVLQSLSLFLSGTSLKNTDFFDSEQPIRIAITFEGIDENDLKLLAHEHRERIAEILDEGTIVLVRQYGTEGKSDLGFFGKVPLDTRFWDERIQKLLKGKNGAELKTVVTDTFPELADRIAEITSQKAAKEAIEEIAAAIPDEQKEKKFKQLPTGLDKSIIPMLPERIYIPAVKDLRDETKAAETSPFGKILAILMRAIEPLLAEEQDLFEKLSKKISRVMNADGQIEDHRLHQVKTIEETIQKYVRESFADVSLEVDIPPPELKSVLSTARILADDGVKGPLELKGDGLRRAVVFSILRAYVELSRAEKAEREDEGNAPERGYLMLFEEPELFLHPDAQKILFDALGVFSKRHHVVVTTHSPLFLGAASTATFVRLSKKSEPDFPKPFTQAANVDLNGIDAKDEFQIICFENNAAAFFAKSVVLVEGDTDYIVFPHIAETLNPEWSCRSKSVSFIRVGGKGSIARYRSFFDRFSVPVHVIADLDALDDDFPKLGPSEEAIKLRNTLLEKADAKIMTEESLPAPNTDTIRKAHGRNEIRQLWESVREAREKFNDSADNFPELQQAVDKFFAWERKRPRRICIEKASSEDVKQAKKAVIWELRKSGIYVLERGAIEDYYPKQHMGSDKPEKAQSFCRQFTKRDDILPLSATQECPISGAKKTEFEFIFSSIFS